jgi:hypothetical protein
MDPSISPSSQEHLLTLSAAPNARTSFTFSPTLLRGRYYCSDTTGRAQCAYIITIAAACQTTPCTAGYAMFMHSADADSPSVVPFSSVDRKVGCGGGSADKSLLHMTS